MGEYGVKCGSVGTRWSGCYNWRASAKGDE